MVNGWRRQYPFFNGYMGNVAWLPKRKIGISLVVTTGPSVSPDNSTNFSDNTLSKFGAYLTPSKLPSLDLG
jgi:hypothetical protein